VFRRVTGYTPPGHKVWVDLDDPDHVKLHEAMEPYNGSLMVTLLFGRESKSGGDLSPQSRHLARVISGQLDGTIERLGRELATYGRPVYLDIGNEAEFFYPKHPKQYVKAYRRVHDKLQPLCPNVLFFWHTVTVWSPRTQDWYPGDRYVDGIGLSLYNDGQFLSAEHFIDYAKRRGMPVAIFEMGLAPHRGQRGFPVSDWSWEGYHARIFRLVDAHDIRLIGYQGNSEEVFREPGPFHHTRLDYLAPEVREGWADMLKRPRFQP
jgi:hypothetical protein